MRDSGCCLTQNKGGATRPADSCETGGNRTQDSTAKEGHAMKRRWNAALQSLVLVRLGQELGTSSDTAQAVAHTIDFVLGTLARLLS